MILFRVVSTGDTQEHMNLKILAEKATLLLGGEKRGITTRILYLISERFGDLNPDAYGVGLRIYENLTRIEFWSRIPFLGDWQRIQAPRQYEIDLLKKQIAQDPQLAECIFATLWHHEPRMIRHVRRHLEKADIDCREPNIVPRQPRHRP